MQLLPADHPPVRPDPNGPDSDVVARDDLGAPVDTLAAAGQTLMAGGNAGDVLLLDQSGLGTKATLNTAGQPRDVSNDGQRVLAQHGFDEMDADPVVADVYDTSGEVVASARLPELYLVQDVVFLPDGDVIAVTTGGVDRAPGLAYRMTPSPQASGTWTDSYATPATARVVAVSPRSGRVFVGGDEPAGYVDTYATVDGVSTRTQGRPVLPDGRAR